MDNSRTILEHKEAFLQTQIRALTAGLEPAEDWRDYGKESDHGDLRDKVVGDVLTKVNTIFQKHNTSVYSAQAIRHVAEQIDTLYWNKATSDAHGLDSNAAGLDIGADLTLPENIAKLPEEWEEENVTDEASKRYQSLQARLAELDVERIAKQRQLAQYTKLNSLLKPFENSQENIQQNLVTRDGELAKELEKMRLLIAKVAVRIGQLKEKPDVLREDGGEDFEKKLDAVLPMA